MNIYPQFCFHIGQLIRWQHDIHVTFNLWFASSNANKICFIGY